MRLSVEHSAKRPANKRFYTGSGGEGAGGGGGGGSDGGVSDGGGGDEGGARAVVRMTSADGRDVD